MIINVETAIIGGGPAGLAAAIKNKNAVIFEANSSLGKTILKTGNGRCNFSNVNIDTSRYRNSKFVNKVFQYVSPNKVYEFFDRLGLACYVDNDGKMFPYTKHASTVVDVLTKNIKNFYLDKEFVKEENNILYFKDGTEAKAEKIIYAIGGNKQNKVLGPIETKNAIDKTLDGIRIHAKCSTNNFSECGELLFRKYGISGIVVFNMSRYIKKGDSITLDLLPDFSQAECVSYLQKLFKQAGKKEQNVVELLCGIMLPQIIKAFYKKDTVEYKDISNLVKTFKNIKLEAKGILQEQCQVTRGGVSVKELSSSTLEHKTKINHYYIGETVDVDGPCGGYNLHWAFASGILAGKATQ